jgi:mRNA interferase RelE/StbE
LSERYAVELSKRAAKELRKLDRPATVKALVGSLGYLRVRVGDYRIVYTINEGKLLVLVLALGHRGAIYRDLP